MFKKVAFTYYPVTDVQRARKFAWRHLGIVLTVGVSLVGLLLVVAALLTTGLILLSHKKDEIDGERKAATKAAAQAEAVSQFLTTDLLGQASPDLNARDKKVTVEQLLGRAAQKIDNNPKFAEQPEVEATLRLVIGNTYFKLGVLPEAEKHLRRAVALRRDTLGPEHSDTLAAQEDLADFLNRGLRKADESEPLSRETWEARSRVLGPEHPDTLNSMDTYTSALHLQNKLTEAEPLSRQCWEARQRVLGKDDPDTLTSLHNLVVSLGFQGKWEKAEPLCRECLETKSRVLGREHSETLSTLCNLSHILIMRGGEHKLNEAVRLLKEGLVVAQRVHGKEHNLTLFFSRILVLALAEQGNLDDAEALGWESVSLHRRALPVGHEAIGRALSFLGRVLTEKGKPAEAELLLRETANLFREHQSPKQDLIGEAETWLGACLAALRRYGEAEAFCLRGYDNLKAAPIVPTRYKDQAKERIVKLYEAWGKPDKAAQWRAKQ